MTPWFALLLLAAPGDDLRALLTHRAAVHAPSNGLVLLSLPASIQAQCQQDLADVRLIDDSGSEIPYARVPTPAAAHPPQPLDATVRNLTRRTSGTAANPHYRETVELPLPADVLTAGHWALTLSSGRREFVAQVQVQQGNTPLAQSSLFRVPGTPAKLAVPLPSLVAEGQDALTVQLDNDDGYLQPSFVWTPTDHAAAPATTGVELPIQQTRNAPRRSIYVIERPEGIAPVTLQIATATQAFSRQVSVWDSPSGGTLLGTGSVFRLPNHRGVEELSVALLPTRSRHWRVEIQDDDSPPLQGLQLQALSQPGTLLFAAGSRPIFLYAGGHRTFLPHYDVNALVDVGSAHNLEALPRASVEPLQPNPQFDGAPAFAFAMHPGAAVDPRLYSHVRPVHVAEASEGISSIVLTAEDLAASKQSLADVRLVDPNNRQWPAVLERDSTDTWDNVAIDTLPPQNKTTRLHVHLPASLIRTRGLALDCDAPWFDRAFTLVLTRPDGKTRSSQGHLTRRPQTPGELILPIPLQDVTAIDLQISDGDDAPLPWTGARLNTVNSVLYVAARPGDYRLLLGFAQDSGAHYELTEMRDRVLTVRASVATTGVLEPNPEASLSAQVTATTHPEQALLWGVLVLAIAVLGGLTLRQVRQ